MPRAKTREDRRVALYARVSGRAQDTASQEPELRRWADAQGRPFDWYRDTFTGRTMDRPAFSRLMDDVAAGRVDTIAVWRLDRLGRTAAGLTTLFEDLARRRVNLVSLRDGLDLGTAAGRLMANVLASVAAYETEIRSERVRAGQEAARARGVRFGRPVGTGRPISVTAEQREQVIRLIAEGKGPAEVARAVGIHRATVYRILEDERASVPKVIINTDKIINAFTSHGSPTAEQREQVIRLVREGKNQAEAARAAGIHWTVASHILVEEQARVPNVIIINDKSSKYFNYSNAC